MSATATTFSYRVRDTMGRTQEGNIEAVSSEDARQRLRRDGFHILELKSAEEPWSLLPSRISRQDLIYVTAQLAIMVDTGIILSAALAGIIEQEKNSALRKVLQGLKEAVESGDDFSAALARYPKLFDNTYISLVKASEATGTLGTMLERIAAYMRKESDTFNKVRAAMAYPTIMMVLATGVTIFLLTYVMPKFMPLFKLRQTQLPTATIVLMSVSEVMINYWYLLLAGAAAMAGGFLYGRRTPAGRRILDWIKINSPVVGTMFRKVTISRSIRTLGTLLANGVPVIEALKLAQAVAGNYYYEMIWQKVQEEVTGGKRICEVLRSTPLFPNMLVQMISAGEEAAKLDMVLEKVSTYYDSEVENTLKATTSLIEPLMIAMMGVVVGTIGLALMLPIFNLSRQP
jgi:type IV pilus assembly protein PilC